MKKFDQIFLFIILLLIGSCSYQKPTTIYLIGDSTMADYSDNYDPGKDYMKTRYPMTGWGQVFQTYFNSLEASQFEGLIKSDSVVIKNRARGGRSTRTFFQEGRWRLVHNSLRENDLVLIQFGHNDASEHKHERYINVEGYKEFLRLFAHQTQEKLATPILLTPVCRNYPWQDEQLINGHGEYAAAVKQVANELNVHFIDLNTLSMVAYSKKGKEYVTQHYFMNISANKYEAYPEGLSDNTHFQPEGAHVVAKLVFEALKDLK